MGSPLSPLAVLALLAVTASGTLRLPGPPGPCVDARFLLDAVLAVRPDKDLQRMHVLLAFSPRQDVLCPAAAARLHQNQSVSVRIRAVTAQGGRSVYETLKLPRVVDAVVLLLGGTGQALMTEVWQHIQDGMPRRRSCSPPVLAVVVTGRAGLLQDAVIVQAELKNCRWWQGAIALQSHSYEGAPDQPPKVTIYTSRVLFDAGVRCGKHWSRLAVRARWSPGVLRFTRGRRSLFARPPSADNLEGCVVVVAPMESAPYVIKTDMGLFGLDMSLVQYFAETKNATLEILPARRLGTSTFITKWDNKTENSTLDPVDMLGMGLADLVIGGVFPTAQRYSLFQMSSIYTTDAVRCYLVREHLVPRWQYPFAVLSAKTWALLAFAMLCLGATLTWLNRQGAAANAMLLWGVLLEGRSFPSWMSTRTTLLVFLWIVFSMHFTAGYRASLAMANTGILKRPGASTIQDVNETVRQVGMIDDLLVPFLRDDRQLAQLLGRVTLCGSMLNCSRLIDKSPTEVALLVSGHSMWYLSSRYFTDDRGRPKLQALREALYTFHVSTMLPKDSSILPALNDAITHTQESGLVTSWFKQLQTAIDLYVESTKRDSSAASAQPPSLNLRRIVGPFACLAAGLVVAFGVFVAEHVCYGGQKIVGLDPDEPDEDADAGPKDASVDAPLAALKAELEAEEEAAAQEGPVTTLLVEGTTTLAEGAGRYERAACLEAEVSATLSSAPVPLAVPEALDGVLERVDVLAAATASLPEKEVHLGEGRGRFDRAVHLEEEVLSTMVVEEPGHGGGGDLGGVQAAGESHDRYGTIWADLDTTADRVGGVPDVDAAFGAGTATSMDL